MITAKPTWSDDIQLLFSSPYWLPQGERSQIGRGWNGCMKDYLIDLTDYAAVRDWAVTIYDHLASRNMPLTSDERQFWPLDALETFRLWVNQGCRETAASPFAPQERIPRPQPRPDIPRVRADIACLTPQEIDDFRARLDDVMRIGDPSPDAPWQIWAFIHTNWCLHYQEAFAFWHRAYLMYLETLLGCPIPYWDWMAAEASVDGSPQAGLPQAFLDETYVHPGTGERRPNPLRYAAAKNGRSKACVETETDGAEACRFVQRNPLFYTTGDDQRAARAQLFAMAEIFQQQVVDALKFDVFSQPQGNPGYPWANIPTFDPPQPDDDYPQRSLNFDGAYEQPHDNYHGWIGPDMADNAYTAFDPIFLCYHSNIDRMLEVWIRAHPVAQYTAGVALQPFVGPRAQAIDESTPDQWRYTALGDMAQDSRRLGYDYGPPAAPQFKGRAPVAADVSETGAPAQDAPGASASGAWVIFDGVRCTHESYAIDVFLGGEAGEACASNPGYVGRFSRIGMGIADDKGRCIRHGVSRILDASRAATALDLVPGADPGLTLHVHDLYSGAPLERAEYAALPGFEPLFHWGDPRTAPPPATGTTPCCH